MCNGKSTLKIKRPLRSLDLKLELSKSQSKPPHGYDLRWDIGRSGKNGKIDPGPF